MIRTKEDVQFHQLGYGYNRVPAVNVKNHEGISEGYRKFVKDEEVAPGFTLEWIEANVSDDQSMSAWMAACEAAWEYLQQIAEEIYGTHVRVYSEGRQGGWAYIQGIDHDVESWDAIDLAYWRSFSKRAKLEASDVMRATVWNIYHTYYEPHVTWTQQIPVSV